MAPPNPNPKTAKAEEVNPPRQHKKPPVKFQPPLMPLIDVMFTLMLFFLVSCQYRQQEGVIPANMPQTGAPSTTTGILPPIHIAIMPIGPDTNRTAVYSVSSTGSGGTEITDPAKLYEFLNSKLTENPGMIEAAVTIQPDAYVPWGYVVEAFNQAVRCHYKNIGFSN